MKAHGPPLPAANIHQSVTSYSNEKSWSSLRRAVREPNIPHSTATVALCRRARMFPVNLKMSRPSAVLIYSCIQSRGMRPLILQLISFSSGLTFRIHVNYHVSKKLKITMQDSEEQNLLPKSRYLPHGERSLHDGFMYRTYILGSYHMNTSTVSKST